MDFPFEHDGFRTANPPPLLRDWREHKRVVDLSGGCHVFADFSHHSLFCGVQQSSQRTIHARWALVRFPYSRNWRWSGGHTEGWRKREKR